MIKKITKRFVKFVSVKSKNKQKYVLHQYKKADGSFDYERYKRIQTEGNKRKIDRAWVQESSVIFLSSYIKKHIPNPVFGICHGTRRGLEQTWFSKHLDCHVIGTEISDTANNFPNTVQWDFHDENPDWVNKADFIYSNSFDHAYDPEKALSAWMNMLRPGGVCIIEHTTAHSVEGANELDPFGVSLDIFPTLILEWGSGKYAVREILHEPVVDDVSLPRSFLIIMNN